MFLRSQLYDFDVIAHAVAVWVPDDRVLNNIKIVWTVFEKFQIFMERSGKESTSTQVVENFSDS